MIDTMVKLLNKYKNIIKKYNFKHSPSQFLHELSMKFTSEQIVKGMNMERVSANNLGHVKLSWVILNKVFVEADNDNI